jgi:hypothetical protein
MKITVRHSKSPLAFAKKGGGAWEVWDRYITLDGKDAFHIGNVCGTCGFFFRRLEGAGRNLNPGDLQAQLSAGLNELTGSHISLLSELLPDGAYDFMLLSTTPHMVTPGDADDYFCHEQKALWGNPKYPPHDPGTKYYRGTDEPLNDGAHLYEFLVPMFPVDRLDAQRVSAFERTISEGHRPTALAISVLDIKGPTTWDGNPKVTSHWCLTHYVIDGHHKLFAACRTHRPIGLVSMLATQEGLSRRPDHAKLREILRSDRRA